VRVIEPDGRRRPIAAVPAPVLDRPEAEVWADPPASEWSVCEVVALWREGVLPPGVMPPDSR
jgi:hypothetical protein